MTASLAVDALQGVCVFCKLVFAFEADEGEDVSVEVFFTSPLQHLVLSWDSTTCLVGEFFALWAFHWITVYSDGAFAD